MNGNVPSIAQSPRNARTGNAIMANDTELRSGRKRALGRYTKNGVQLQVETARREELLRQLAKYMRSASADRRTLLVDLESIITI